VQNLQIQKSHKPGSQSDADIYWMRENLQSTVRLCKNCRMPKECKFCKYKNATNLDHKVVQTYNNMRKKLQKKIKTVQTVQNAKRVQNLPIQKSHRPGSQSGAEIYQDEKKCAKRRKTL
jgi:hypothetical protein